MKKILFVMAILAGVQVANAQVKSISTATSALNSAIEASNNEKKAEKFATWIKLGQSYIDAYDAPAGNAWVGASKMELSLVVSEKPTAVEEVVIGGAPYTKEIYANANYYFDANGNLKIIEVTKPICQDALTKAAAAFSKAYTLDEKKSKEKDIKEGLSSIHNKLVTAAYDKYTFGAIAEASELFKKAFDVSTTEPITVIDTLSLYYAGQTANISNQPEKAKEYLELCINKYGYETENGDIHANLADIYLKEGNNEKAKAMLEKGFEVFPQGQSIIIGLINYYLTNNEDPTKLFDLLDKAKINEPKNASLYYVEGNIHGELGNYEKAVAAYEKCAEIDPNYAFGYIGEGQMLYKKAIAIQEQAQNEMDDAKYMALVKDFEEALKACIAPFEKGFEITKDDAIKEGISEYIKNAAFRFREEPEYQAIYEKYNSYFTNK